MLQKINGILIFFGFIVDIRTCAENAEIILLHLFCLIAQTMAIARRRCSCRFKNNSVGDAKVSDDKPAKMT